MKHRILLIILAIIFLMPGCTKTLLLINGVKQPKIENYQSEIEYLTKYKLPSDEVVVFRDSTGLLTIFSKGIGIPDAAFFNSDGYYVPYKNDSVDCNAGISPFIEAIAKGATHRVDSSFRMEDIYNELVYSETKSALDTGDLNGKFDYYVMFFWSGYIGILNKKKVHEWYITLQDSKNAGLSIRAYYVNVDCQEFWGYTSKDIPKFKY